MLTKPKEPSFTVTKDGYRGEFTIELDPNCISFLSTDPFTIPSYTTSVTYGTPGKYLLRPKIEKVIFNPPATVILWKDGSRTIVKTQNGEPFDKEKGFVMAYLKRLLGNDNTFNKEIHKWVDE